jgi:hypothetical protein
MKMHIKTTAQGCHVTVSIKIDGQTLLNLLDNDERELDLFPGLTYRFEWFVITSQDAHASVEAVVTPASSGFHPLNIQKDYPAGVKDGNLFLFTLN